MEPVHHFNDCVALHSAAWRYWAESVASRNSPGLCEIQSVTVERQGTLAHAAVQAEQGDYCGQWP